jgi:tRNA pseudouridine38-40 synthase
MLGLNHLLPKAISVWHADEMPSGFDAKKHAVGKRYVYQILNASARDPFAIHTVWHVRKPLDVAAMREAAKHLVGHLDFESFRSVYCQASHGRRYLWKIDVAKIGDLIKVDVRGNAFCHNQVRIIVGTLVDVGMGRIGASNVSRVLEARDRKLAGRTAPASGLTLEQVYYPDDLGDACIPPDASFPRYPVTQESWPFCL